MTTEISSSIILNKINDMLGDMLQKYDEKIEQTEEVCEETEEMLKNYKKDNKKLRNKLKVLRERYNDIMNRYARMQYAFKEWMEDDDYDWEIYEDDAEDDEAEDDEEEEETGLVCKHRGSLSDDESSELDVYDYYSNKNHYYVNPINKLVYNEDGDILGNTNDFPEDPDDP